MSSTPASRAEHVHRLFDEKAVNWPAHYQPDGRLFSRLTRLGAVVGSLAAPGSRVLDLGCGSGDLAMYLARCGFQVTGCDVSGRMLRQARSADSGQSVDWLEIDPAWQRLPFDSGSFSAVVASSVLEYVDSPETVLAECARILRPGGSFVGTVPNLAHPVRWLEGIAQAISQTGVFRRLLLPRSPQQLTAYVTYLDLSRQRRPQRHWHALAGRAGFRPVPTAAKTAGRPTLRVLALRVNHPEGE